MMITKSALKFIKSLQLKKNRIEHQRFLVEGIKSVKELLESDYAVELIAGTSTYINEQSRLLNGVEVAETKEVDIRAVSSFKNNNSVVAVVEIPYANEVEIPSQGYTIMLDDIRDPGNLGTIIRIADWYGIDQIIASETTTDIYNPKVISASMGSFTRVRVNYTDLSAVLHDYKGDVYGAMMEGQLLPEASFSKQGVIIMGNESNGISEPIQKFITNKITIPRYGRAESLNVGIATAVICDRMRTSV